jgi:membrane protein implicated in regulation of membrane protease activity
MIDSIINYIQRNPLTTIIIVMLIVFAPSAFGALLVGVAVVLLLLLAIPIYMLYRVRRMSRKMEDQAREQSQQRGFYGRTNTQSDYGRSAEGEVRVHTTSEQPQKRVNENVGDYVDFEEVKEKK